MRKKALSIACAVLSLLLAVSCFKIYQLEEKLKSPYSGYIPYLVEKRFDAQGDIYLHFAQYLSGMAEGTVTAEEFLAYADGANIFYTSIGDLIDGAYNIALEDSPILELLPGIQTSTDIPEEDLAALGPDELTALANSYDQLERYFKANKKALGLPDYVYRNADDTEGLSQLIADIEAEFANIKELLPSQKLAYA